MGSRDSLFNDLITSGTPGASNYLLAIFFMNLTIYGIYYCAMKQINGEKINKIPLVRSSCFLIWVKSRRMIVLLNQVYACLGLICFVPSLYFFTKVSQISFTNILYKGLSKILSFLYCLQRNLKTGQQLCLKKHCSKKPSALIHFPGEFLSERNLRLPVEKI